MEAMNADLEPPRSWPNEMKNRFKNLPHDVAVFIETHERRRDLEMRRCHNELAKARQACTALRNITKGKSDGTNVENTSASA